MLLEGGNKRGPFSRQLFEVVSIGCNTQCPAQKNRYYPHINFLVVWSMELLRLANMGFNIRFHGDIPINSCA
ncbi:hypothetical protein YSA_00687 [Pseudomonas putida ND6]|uniref:Uncharacterized protein n=1 Tax=Pseudomonas putida ND6 TaxID=231023 RepID=I3UNS6_PSEPU|nr:hypothetical protein YSA_00687 [Pseudomonas putida ND6]